MKKYELLEKFDDALMDKLFGFCYARTKDSYTAQELCSDIIFALVKSAHTEGNIEEFYPFVWKVARNVYADFSCNRRKHAERFYEGDSDEIFQTLMTEEEPEDYSLELLRAVYRRIAFLTRAYREVMILYYLDGLSTAEIAKCQNTSEGAVRQRLFSARQKVKSEVEEMMEVNHKPVALNKIDYTIWGTGHPGWGDPREVCTRMFSKHIVWLCRKKAMTAGEIAKELNVPTIYVEEELEILTKGENGEYGMLRKLDNGKYSINFVLLEKNVIEQVHLIYIEQIPEIGNTLADYIEKHKQEYLAFPYLNKQIDFNLILWQQIFVMAKIFSEKVEKILEKKYFPHTKRVERPFSVFGYVDNGTSYGGGWDGAEATNICGYSKVFMDNIYITRIKKHFECGLNISNDEQIQLTIRAIKGIKMTSLSENEKEIAAKAIECGYLYREGDMLYTKILVHSIEDGNRLFAISNGLQEGYFEKDAEIVAEKLAALITKSVPDYLLDEWRYANILAAMPVLDGVVEMLIEKGLLIPPENGIGAEGCWMGVSKL